MIARRAGRRPVAEWFERDAARQRYPAARFPRFMLTRRWPEPGQRRLAAAFIDWWAAAPLQLQHLTDSGRATLEAAAARRATLLARLYRLYPKLLDERLIRVARVQARMQASNATIGRYAEPFVWSE